MSDNNKLQNEYTGRETVSDLAADFSKPKGGCEGNCACKTAEPIVLTLDLKVEKLEHYDGEQVPEEMRLPPLLQATPGSVGIDLYAANFEPLLLNSIGATVVVPVGIKIELPLGYEAQIRPRSGLAAKNGLTVLNSPGTIDSDYRGEIKVIITKMTTGKFQIHRGMRIAQMVVAPVVMPKIVYVNSVDVTSRGAGGFGSTGT